jgi:hypothetical protein
MDLFWQTKAALNNKGVLVIIIIIIIIIIINVIMQDRIGGHAVA